jgi:acetyl esterase/lipase
MAARTWPQSFAQSKRVMHDYPMKCETIPLGDTAGTPYLETYLLDDSKQFNTGKLRPIVIICPGGGYMFTSDREAEPIALHFLKHGYHAVVLRYTVNTRLPQPMIDMARAILYVRAHAASWHADPGQLAVCGFSAGGHLCAAAGVFWDAPWLCEAVNAQPAQLRPDALILGYPVIDLSVIAPVKTTDDAEFEYLRQRIDHTIFGTANPTRAQYDMYALNLHVTPRTPPAFIWHTADDGLVPAQNALLFAAACDAQRVPYELHIFRSGTHGLAMADATTATSADQLNPAVQPWIGMALTWLSATLA